MRVGITEEANRQYQRLPKSEQTKIRRKLLTLETNPLLGKKLGGELASYRSLRAWPYRIIYTLDQKKNELTVKSIHHRQGAYK